MTTNKKSTRYYSGRQERTVAKNLKGRLSANSGAGKFSGGDVKLENFLIECKTSTKDKLSFSVRKEWLDKVKSEALSLRVPYSCLAFNFGPEQKNYYVIDETLMKILTDAIGGTNDEDK